VAALFSPLTAVRGHLTSVFPTSIARHSGLDSSAGRSSTGHGSSGQSPRQFLLS